jgi:hypothetical protein
MGRPKKETVDFFPHFTNASNGRTLTILQSRFGNDGYAAWFKILELLGRSPGHFYSAADDESCLFLETTLGVSDVSATEILGLLAKLKAIDLELWDKRIIWCQNLVNNLTEVYRKRKQDLPSKPVISATEMHRSKISATETRQSRLNKTIGKETKGESTRPPAPAKSCYGEFQNILLTEAEHEKVLTRFGAGAPELIEAVSSWLESTGTKRKSHYATILTWARRDKEDRNNGRKPQAGQVRANQQHPTETTPEQYAQYADKVRAEQARFAELRRKPTQRQMPNMS